MVLDNDKHIKETIGDNAPLTKELLVSLGWYVDKRTVSFLWFKHNKYPSLGISLYGSFPDDIVHGAKTYFLKNNAIVQSSYTPTYVMAKDFMDLYDY